MDWEKGVASEVEYLWKNSREGDIWLELVKGRNRESVRMLWHLFGRETVA